jgi:hypothetical protein
LAREAVSLENAMHYEPIEPVSRDVAEAATTAAPDVLLRVVLAVGMHETDRAWAEAFVIRFASHPDDGVRGAALECFGHLARRFQSLDQARALPLLQAGLRDADAWVRGKANDAADDVEFFSGWVIERPVNPGESN